MRPRAYILCVIPHTEPNQTNAVVFCPLRAFHGSSALPDAHTWESSQDSSWPRGSWQMGIGQGGTQPRPPLSRLPRGRLPVGRPPAATGSTVVKPRFYPRLCYSTPPLFTWQRKTGHSAIRTIPERQANARSQPERDIHHVTRLAINLVTRSATLTVDGRRVWVPAQNQVGKVSWPANEIDGGPDSSG